MRFINHILILLFLQNTYGCAESKSNNSVQIGDTGSTIRDSSPLPVDAHSFHDSVKPDSISHSGSIEKCSVNCPQPDWIHMRGSSFEMGTNDGHDFLFPLHTVNIDDFEIARAEVTVSEYHLCVKAGVCNQPEIPQTTSHCNWDDSGPIAGFENHPINVANWYDARRYCQWIEGRLPSEAEWEFAARSGGKDIAHPWGYQLPSCEYAVMFENTEPGCESGTTMPVCSKPNGNTEQGVCDMLGNVNEWVEDDAHGSYVEAPSDGSSWIDEPRSTNSVTRGGSFAESTDYPTFNIRYRNFQNKTTLYCMTGFRCAKDTF